MADDILGTYDLTKKVEDTVVLLENTKKAYGNPDWVVEIESGLLNMINTKLAMEKTSRFALVTFSSHSNIELKMEEFSPEAFQDALYNIQISPNNIADINSGMSAAFQVTVENMQKLSEGKRFRMVVISEGDLKEYGEKWRELVDICSKVGIIIDVVQVATFTNPSKTLETIASRTTGMYYLVKSPSEVEGVLTEIAPNRVEASDDAFQSQEDRDLKGLLEYVAAELKSLNEGIQTVGDLKKIVTQEDEDFKCAICHSPDCMFCKGPAFSCGAFCPSCGRFFHQHCCAGWAESQKDTPKNVFKCPICFHLLKVPGSLHRISVLKENLKENEPRPDTVELKLFNINEIGQQGAFKFCSWCRNVFSPAEEIYNCPKCNSLYHQDCMDDMTEKTHNRCRVCDAPLGGSVKKAAGIERIV